MLYDSVNKISRKIRAIFFKVLTWQTLLGNSIIWTTKKAIQVFLSYSRVIHSKIRPGVVLFFSGKLLKIFSRIIPAKMENIKRYKNVIHNYFRRQNNLIKYVSNIIKSP